MLLQQARRFLRSSLQFFFSLSSIENHSFVFAISLNLIFIRLFELRAWTSQQSKKKADTEGHERRRLVKTSHKHEPTKQKRNRNELPYTSKYFHTVGGASNQSSPSFVQANIPRLSIHRKQYTHTRFIAFFSFIRTRGIRAEGAVVGLV